jgi:hypothetical protein
MIGEFPRFLNKICLETVEICCLGLFNRLKVLAFSVGIDEL